MSTLQLGVRECHSPKFTAYGNLHVVCAKTNPIVAGLDTDDTPSVYNCRRLQNPCDWVHVLVRQIAGTMRCSSRGTLLASSTPAALRLRWRAARAAAVASAVGADARAAAGTWMQREASST